MPGEVNFLHQTALGDVLSTWRARLVASSAARSWALLREQLRLHCRSIDTSERFSVLKKKQQTLHGLTL